MTLDQCRSEIDRIDRDLLALFEARMAQVAQVAAYKKAHQLSIFRPDREQDILRRHTAEAKEGQALAVRMLFTELMELSKTAQLCAIDAPIPPLSVSPDATDYRLVFTMADEPDLHLRVLNLFAVFHCRICEFSAKGEEQKRFTVRFARETDSDLPHLMQNIHYYAESWALEEV